MTTRRLRVLLQQNSVAHYRAALYRELAKQPDVSFDFLADPRSDTPFLLAADGDSAPIVSARLHVLFGGRVFWQPGALRQVLGSSYDVVIALGSAYSLTTWALLLLAPFRGYRILLWTHGLLRPEKGPKWWLRGLQYRLATGLLLYGQRGRDLLLAQGFSARRLFVIFNSLDFEEQRRHFEAARRIDIDELRASLGLCEAERVVIFVGRLQPVKRLDLIITALARLRDRGRSVHALLVGEGQERDNLLALARRLGVVSRVHLVGPCHDEQQLARYFRAADLCLIPSGAGLGVIHALGYRTPVATHNDPCQQFPEIEALVADENGAFFRPDDEVDLTRCLEAALYPRTLKQRMEELGTVALPSAFRPDEQARKMTQACRDVVVSGFRRSR